MLHSSLPSTDTKQWLALYNSVLLFETGTVRQFHERHLARHGTELMARVYQASMEQLLSNACALQRSKLRHAFRRVVSDAIDAHFSRLDLADSSLRLSLAENAKEWLAFVHCMATAERMSFHNAYAEFMSCYGSEFKVAVYQKAFEQVLHLGTPGESIFLLSTLQQALDQALDATPSYREAA